MKRKRPSTPPEILPLTPPSLRLYLPELESARARRDKSLQDAKDDSMGRLMKDLAVDHAKDPSFARRDRWDPEEDDEENDDEADGEDIDIIDRSESVLLIS